ncbi:Flp family type IVb pilin [Nocardioides sp. Kera G14]|nr:Flp family type IVb pilin [Nocardioides sp. Kera G14]UDY22530.1 Flp family type IVb pilin [Nocardioides sp. Kera G14]
MEYGLLVAGIAAVIVVIVMVLGDKVKDAFNKTCGAISAGSAGTGAETCK